MSASLTCFWTSLLLFILFHGALSVKKGYYTIVSPGSVRPESAFHVSLTLNDFHKSCWFNISLTTFVKHNPIYEFESIEVEPGTTKLVELQAPSLDHSVGHLDVIGYRGIISKDSATIYFQSNNYWAFVQTNKPKYKPGELVQIRVICIDQLTRPAKLDQEISVEIYDDQHNLVRGIFDVKLVQGVFKTEFQLSKYPVLGVWQIRVDGLNIYTQKTFEVERYVLPKFSVSIKTEFVETDRIALEISANYFYGQPVRGNLSLSYINTHVPTNKWIPDLTTITEESRIDGNTKMFLDLKNYIQLEYDSKDEGPLTAYSQSTYRYTFSIEANIIDDISEEKAWAETEVYIYDKPYIIKLEVPEKFHSAAILKFKIKVLMRDRADKLVQDTETPIQVVVGCDKVIGYNRNYIKFDTVRVDYKVDPGEDFATVNMANKNYTECFAYAEYQGIKSPTENMYKNKEVFNMNILTESPQEGKELEIEITNPEPFEEFSYEIVSRGDIIQSGHVLVPGNKTSYILRLNVTFLMVPKITIYAHHIKNMNFGGQLKDVIIERAHQNSIEIQTEEESQPGTSVSINVTTDEGSYVGLMGLDRSALQNINEDEIFDENFVKTKLKRVNSEKYYPIPFYGITYHIITLSNVFPPGRENGPEGGEDAGGGEVTRIRNIFPESWLFMDFESTPKGGFNIIDTTPDTITTWAITGFSLHPENGLSFTRNITDLKVFQEFFVSMDLPSLVKEGEIIEVPIYISNYMNQDTLANLTIEIDNQNFDILEDPEAISKAKQNVSKLIATKRREKIVFFVRPLKPGHYNVTAKAISSVASDAVQKTLNVQPQGVPYETTKTYLVHLTEESIQEDEITIDIPENAIPGSRRVEVSVVGDVFRPLINKLQKMAKVPYGNGEDNMKLIVSNSIVLKYLKALNYSDPNLESKMKLNLELGYQNELSFKYLDGSFGLFERKSERTGDIWQTVFALWGLNQAKDFISIDSKVIERGLEYLESKQQENGCYKSESGIEEDVKFTAFGLMVFLMDENSRTKYNQVIEKGLKYLFEVSDDLEYSPIAVMAGYVLHLGKHEKAEEYLRKLTSQTSFTTKQVLWTKSDTLQSDLETTASSLINLFESKDKPEPNLLYIVKGLIVSKKDESAITHMVALQAMISFAEKLSLSKTNLNISFEDDQNQSGDFQLNDENSQVLQTFELARSSGKLKIQSKGHGFAMVDVKYEYNLIPESQSSSIFSTNISIEIYSNFLIYLPICSRILENATQNKFIIMEVSLQSGFIFTEGNFNDIDNQNDDIKSIQYNDSRDKVVVYFEYDPNNEASCIELEARKTYKVFKSKPGWIIVYGDYDKDQKSIESFMVDDE